MTKKNQWIYSVCLLIYHLLFAWIAYRYILENNGDAMRYWFVGQDLRDQSWAMYFKPGTDLVKFITFPLVKYLALPLWAGFIFFSLLGFAGLLFLWRLLLEIAGNNQKIIYLGMFLLLLPNLHFWTANIGKEALIILPVVLLLQEVVRKNYASVRIGLALLAIGLIRPHVGFVFLAAYLSTLLLCGDFSKRMKLYLLAVFVLLSAVFTFILINLQDFSGGIQRVKQKYEVHIAHFQKTDAYVPLDQYSLPYKIFTFYFRPLPFEKKGIFYQVLSAENLVILLFFGWSSYLIFRYFKKMKFKIRVVFPLMLLLLFALMYVYAYANYGIIMRTRIMVTPVIYLLLVYVFSEAVTKKQKILETVQGEG